MSISPSSRSSLYGDASHPTTPDSTRSASSRTSCFSVAPKSEYLKSAIQARRVQTTPSRTLQDLALKSPSPAPSAQETKTPEPSPDLFLQYALSEELTAPVSPVWQRRGSSKTNRDLSKEVEQLKESLMTANMRVELLNKHKKETQSKLTSALDELERLEFCKEEADHLRTENQSLKLKMERMAREMARLRKLDEERRKITDELTAIASESAAHWSAHEIAIEEAAEYIIKMEEEKAALTKEVRELKQRVTAIEAVSAQSPLAAGPDKYPSRVCSVDESRPSTSHFDSDYYSMPASPQVKQSGDSVKSLVPSERSRKFLYLTDQHRQSARDLIKRISAASLKVLGDATSSPTNEQQVTPVEEEEDRSPTPRDTFGRQPRNQRTASPSLMDAAAASPSRPHTVAPLTETTPRSGGLRGLFRPGRSSSRKSSERRSSSGQFRSSTGADRLASRPQTTYEIQHRHSISSGSEVDLASVVDPLEDKDRWWRGVDRLTLDNVIAQYATSTGPQQSDANPAAIQDGQSARVNVINTLTSDSKQVSNKVTPSTKADMRDEHLGKNGGGIEKVSRRVSGKAAALKTSHHL